MRSTGRDETVLGRAFSVLDAFRGEREPLSLAEITRRTGLPKSTTHRVLGELLRLGAVDRWGDHYVVGLAMWELGGLALPQRLRELTIPYLEDLRRLSGGVVHLGVLQGRDVVYLEKMAGHRAVQVPTRLGGRLPAHATALGRAILATLPVAEARGLAPDDVWAEIEQVRVDGVAFEREEGRRGVSSVAAAVVPAPLLPTAISVTCRTGAVDLDAMAPAVSDVAGVVGKVLAGVIRTATASGRIY